MNVSTKPTRVTTALLKKTWGEQVVGNFGVSAVITLVGFVLTFIFIPLIAFSASAQQPALIIATVVGFVVSLLALALVGATLSGIYTAALYRYASEGQMGEGFSPEMVREAFRPK
jgi:predicted membrane channel-forming protein YqfA (hemolysin III family)